MRQVSLQTIIAVAVAIGLLTFDQPSVAVAQEGPIFADPTAACYAANDQTIVCSGDWSGGVEINNPGQGTSYDRLELSSDVLINPTSAPAIGITTATDFTLKTTEANAFDISTTGDDNHGIVFRDATVTGDFTLKIGHYGNITTNGQDSTGIRVVHNSGTLGSTNRLIDIDHFGDITTLGTGISHGIRVKAQSAILDIDHTGDITAQGRAITARVGGEGGKITITQIGNLQGEFGVHSEMNAGGDITLTTIGNILTSLHDGLLAYVNNAPGDITITHRGDIDARLYGVNATMYDGGHGVIDVDVTGDIYANRSGAAWADGICDGDGIWSLDGYTSTVLVRHVGTIFNHSADGSQGKRGPNGIDIGLADGGSGQVFHAGAIHTIAGSGISVDTNIANLGEVTITLGQTETALDGTSISGTVISSRDGK